MTRIMEHSHRTGDLSRPANDPPNLGTKCSKWMIRFVKRSHRARGFSQAVGDPLIQRPTAAKMVIPNSHPTAPELMHLMQPQQQDSGKLLFGYDFRSYFGQRRPLRSQF
ncbi:hypothetical protein [Bradyrhizobium sp. Ai1a-2]|uniref:hypothetical protein n=1 Tax=Bradyrhizobium sp. Ai1a-2 TaxID=196490 RepID=UPI000484FE49|nr:hypothetical protein [Bradyrhizobium sp. Ai1a-2]